MLWLAILQPETLAVEKRAPLSLSRVFSAIWEVCTHRIALGYTLTSGFISGIFLAFLSTSPQTLQEQYELGAQFPIYFALLSLSVGLASFINGKIVIRFGMRLLCHRALHVFFPLPFTLVSGSKLQWPPTALDLHKLPVFVFFLHRHCMGQP
jgi:DHA1 family bicyclomycin/chloramphenicol resistance-like MFS transporter